MMLAIEISQRIGSVALRADNGTIHVEHLSPAEGKVGRHGDDLMPAIDRLFTRLDLKPSALKTVAVSIGPGSFTGLRVAVSTARMFAEALSAKIIAVPSALVAAENFAPEGGCRWSEVRGQRSEVRSQRSEVRGHGLDDDTDALTSDLRPLTSGLILVALAGKRDTFWATYLRRGNGHWSIAGTPGLANADSIDLADVTCVLADEYLPEDARNACRSLGIPVVEPRLDASACLRVAERLAAASSGGAFADPLMLLPLYPRQPEAVTIWDQRQKNPKSRP